MDQPELSEREKRAYHALAEAMMAYQRSKAPHIRLLRTLGVGYFQAAAWKYGMHCRRRRLTCWLRAIPIIVMAWARYWANRLNQAVTSLPSQMRVQRGGPKDHRSPTGVATGRSATGRTVGDRFGLARKRWSAKASAVGWDGLLRPTR